MASRSSTLDRSAPFASHQATKSSVTPMMERDACVRVWHMLRESRREWIMGYNETNGKRRR